VDLDGWRLARDPIAGVQGKLLRVPKSPASADERVGTVKRPTVRSCRIEGVAKFVYLCVGLYVNNGRSDPAFSTAIRIRAAPNADSA
jgi:hypothetical protein